MFRPHYQIHTTSGNGTHFEKRDILNPIKKFLARHDIPSEIINDVKFSGNDIYVKLKKGSIDEYGERVKSAFNTLKSSSFSYSLMCSENIDDMIYCWVPFLENIVEANNIYEFELLSKDQPLLKQLRI